MRIDVISIFPEYLAPLELSLIGKARQDGIVDLRVKDLREFTTDRHRTVDDSPYGGGAGMVMKAEPWSQALSSLLESVEPPTPGSQVSRPDPSVALPGAAAPGAAAPGAATPGVATPGVAAAAVGTAPDPAAPAPGVARPTLLVPSPAGEVFDQSLAHNLAAEDHLVFACGRYEGIDERVIDWAKDYFTVRPVSLGDYVLNGGEVAVLAMVEAIGRLLPGVVGNPESLVEESHADGLLEYPVYTKPSTWRDRAIPEILLSGNHAKIAEYRREEQLRRTAARRPDLIRRLDPASLSKRDLATLAGLGYIVSDGRVLPQPDARPAPPALP